MRALHAAAISLPGMWPSSADQHASTGGADNPWPASRRLADHGRLLQAQPVRVAAVLLDDPWRRIVPPADRLRIDGGIRDVRPGVRHDLSNGTFEMATRMAGRIDPGGDDSGGTDAGRVAS